MSCDFRCFNRNSKWWEHTNCETCPCKTGKGDFLEKRRSDEQIVKACNKLAAAFYSSVGYDVAADFKFYESICPEEKAMWDLAVIAYDRIQGTDVEDALANLED